MDRPVTGALALTGARTRRERKQALTISLLAAPALLFLALLFLYPLSNLIGLSFNPPHFVAEYYRRFVTSAAYIDTSQWTLGVCVFITACCLVLGYPTALFLGKAAKRGHGYLLALVVFPYLTSLLVRTYAWMVLLSDEGPINGVLLATGLVSHPVKLLFNTTRAMIGMVHLMLPLMILPIYSVIPESPMVRCAPPPRWAAARFACSSRFSCRRACRGSGAAARLSLRSRWDSTSPRQPLAAPRHNALQPDRVAHRRCARLQVRRGDFGSHARCDADFLLSDGRWSWLATPGP